MKGSNDKAKGYSPSQELEKARKAGYFYTQVCSSDATWGDHMSRWGEAQKLWGILTVASWTQCCRDHELPTPMGPEAHREVN